MMHLNDGDLEFVFAMYDSGKALMPNDVAREQWAENTIRNLTEYGFTLELISTELGEYDVFLANALDLIREYEEDDGDDAYSEDDEFDDY